MAPADDPVITAVLGPTNTGKTHYAIERMLTHRTGVIGLPLRLLAREVYDRVVAKRGPNAAALITGEEKIVPARAQYMVCTVEAMPLDGLADFVAVDEIQLCADPDRGHVFTDRLLHARGRRETLFMGSDVMRGRIASLVPRARFMSMERFSTLSYGGPRKLSRLKPRTAVVAFSVDQVYAIAELIRRQRGGAAVVMGALSPRTRNAQVRLYQEGDVDYLVATDAIGMGLNLDVDHIAFAGVSKFDGHRHRTLMPNEIGQIAGRAGRYTKDGSFGVTGEVPAFDPELVEAVENHRFKPLDKLHWRNGALEFGTLDRLVASLERPPEAQDLIRAREADDLATLRLMQADDEVRRLADHPLRIRLLWDCCQIPDFRKVMTGDHAALIGRIFRFLAAGPEVIPSDWIAGQVDRLDRTDGDIDALSKRLAYIRTWTYVANRAGWLDDPAAWRETTRTVEDKLSDALHERLTQRFVDRRTSVLMRRLKQKERLVAEVNDNGEVTVEGEFAGRLDGFRFTADESAVGAERKVLQSASLAALQAELNRRADKLYNAPDGEIALTEQGGLMWQTDAVGALEKGDAILAPAIRVFVDDIADPQVAEKVQRRLGHWLDRRTKALFEPMLAMQGDEAVTGLARGVAFQLSEALGILPRRDIADDVKALGQDERAQLRKHGVRFGQHHVFMPLLLKPAPTRLRLVLWGLWEGLQAIPAPPPPGQVTVPVEHGQSAGYWTKAGYRVAGPRALRIDMLERLADMLRPMDARAGFEATPDMLSITGCTLEQFAEMMDGLGYQGERGERPKTVRRPTPPSPPATQAAEAATPEALVPEAAPAEAAAPATAAPETASPETAAPETASPEIAPPETATPDTATPETAAPETATPETATPETATPETATPETATPETAVSEPATVAALTPDAAAPATGAEADVTTPDDAEAGLPAPGTAPGMAPGTAPDTAPDTAPPSAPSEATPAAAAEEIQEATPQTVESVSAAASDDTARAEAPAAVAGMPAGTADAPEVPPAPTAETLSDAMTPAAEAAVAEAIEPAAVAEAIETAAVAEAAETAAVAEAAETVAVAEAAETAVEAEPAPIDGGPAVADEAAEAPGTRQSGDEGEGETAGGESEVFYLFTLKPR
ncbi:MAG: helicase-related protein, partial [Pseudomonadota bacterium]